MNPLSLNLSLSFEIFSKIEGTRVIPSCFIRNAVRELPKSADEYYRRCEEGLLSLSNDIGTRFVMYRKLNSSSETIQWALRWRGDYSLPCEFHTKISVKNSEDKMTDVLAFIGRTGDLWRAIYEEESVDFNGENEIFSARLNIKRSARSYKYFSLQFKGALGDLKNWFNKLEGEWQIENLPYDNVCLGYSYGGKIEPDVVEELDSDSEVVGAEN